MPVHDWSRVKAGIFHDFHHAWIEEIKRELNRKILPSDYYALAEQHAGGFGPDVLTLQRQDATQCRGGNEFHGGGGVSLAPPPIKLTAEADEELYRRRQREVVVRHVTDDKVIAVVEIVSPGNKSGPHALDAFIRKAIELMQRDIHLLILDAHPPGNHDPAGIHDVIWTELTDKPYQLPKADLLTVASYESVEAIRAYVEHTEVGKSLPAMPLFLAPGAHVMVPTEETYVAAFEALPRRWQQELI